MKVPIILILTTFSINVMISCQSIRNRVVYVNSYHSGYKPSDEIMRGIRETLTSDKFDLQILFIDSKRQTSLERLSEKIDSARNFILDFKPDVLIVSDDYAVKYLVNPFFNQFDIPIVFCGVNWSAEQYNLSPSHITGMIEVLPLHEAIRFIKGFYPTTEKLAVLSEKSLSELNNTKLLDTLYKNLGMKPEYFLADNFEDWKKMFVMANDQADIIYLPTNGAIKDWDESMAIKFVKENIRKPVFTCDDFMMDYCVFGFTKIPIEQGIFAAETAKNILHGTSPAKIPIKRNKQTETWYNKKLAQIIGFSPDSSWLETAKLMN